MPKLDPWQFDIELEFVRETDKAILVREVGIAPEEIEDNVTQWWIPKSQIVDSDLEIVGDQGQLTISGWLAKQLELSDD